MTLCLTIDANKKFVILIATYNNEKFVEHNLRNALKQNYSSYRIIIIDDASTDSTLSEIQKIVSNSPKKNIVTLVHNETRQGALANHYYAIHNLIEDDEIVVILDGDDTLPNRKVLLVLNEAYSKNDIWLTFGQYREKIGGSIGFNKPFPADVIRNNSFRKWPNIPSHLRTFYAWLFKQIKKEDLMLDGNFFSMCADMAAMIPMIEMAGERHKCFERRVLYIYNNNNPLSDHVISREYQQQIDAHIRSLKPYQRLP